mmetsp:Transcript_20333/g.60756  ORF Transcript_20333/g.60756 Transcript_20333/m.60756 type:complete len:228 (-) Transcript_20333:172-855(-)
MQRRHDWQREGPPLERRARHGRLVSQALVLVEPVIDRAVLNLVEVHANGLHRRDAEDVVGVVERRFFVVERRKPHPLEVHPVPLLPPHHDPHGAPLRGVDGLNHKRDFVHKGDGPSDVVQHFDVADLLPRHWHVLEQLEHGMRHVLERPEVHALVVPKLAVRHIAVVGNDLPDVLWREILLLRVHKAKLALFGIPLGLKLLPFSSLLFELRLRGRSERRLHWCCRHR